MRGELCLGTSKSGGFQGSAAVNRRLGSPLARGDGELPLLNAFKGAILSRNRRNLADVRLVTSTVRSDGLFRRPGEDLPLHEAVQKRNPSQEPWRRLANVQVNPGLAGRSVKKFKLGLAAVGAVVGEGRRKLIRGITKLLMSAVLCSLPVAGAWADGAVYAMTNAVGNNQILAYHRARDGTLTLMQTINTGGGGSGAQLSPPDSLGSQGSLVLDDQHHLLFAVNTETLAENSQDCQQGTITSFLVARDGRLILADRVISRGLFPNSLAVRTNNIHNEQSDEVGKENNTDLLYVLNAGGPGASPFCGSSPNIAGFRVDSLGKIRLLSDSVQAIIDPGPLDGTGFGVNCPVSGFPTPSIDCGRNPPAFPRSPAQVQFTPDGTQLIVTVKGTNKIYVFAIGESGAPMVTQAPGPALPTYFGFTFDWQGHLILTEPFGQATNIPAAGTGAVSSFAISETGGLQQISASVGDGGTAPCWIALEPVTGRYAYVSNNLSNGLSSYSVGNDGSLTLLMPTAATANGPNDLAAVAEGGTSFLYVLDAGDGTVGAFQVNLRNGSLTPLAAVGGLPASDGAAGLAAY